jgi:hypothetical protein
MVSTQTGDFVAIVLVGYVDAGKNYFSASTTGLVGTA